MLKDKIMTAQRGQDGRSMQLLGMSGVILGWPTDSELAERVKHRVRGNAN